MTTTWCVVVGTSDFAISRFPNKSGLFNAWGGRCEVVEPPWKNSKPITPWAFEYPISCGKAALDMRLIHPHSAPAEHTKTSVAALHACGEKTKRLQKHQANLQADLVVRQDTSGDKFTMVIGGQTFTERRAAGFEILRLSLHHVARLNRNEAREIGTFAGFKIQLRRAFFDNKPASVELAGHALYEAELSDSPLGVIASLENQLRRLEEKFAAAALAESQCAEHMTRLRQSLDGGFQHTQRLAQLRVKQASLNEELQASKGETMAVGEEIAVEEPIMG